MSAGLMARVYESDLDADVRPVALALAFHADDRGLSLFPSLEHLAWKLKRKRRSVSAAIARLRDLGVLEPLEPLIEVRGHLQPRGGAGRVPQYRFVADALPTRPSWREERAKKGCRKLHPFQIEKGCKQRTKRVQFAPDRVPASIDLLKDQEKKSTAAPRPEVDFDQILDRLETEIGRHARLQWFKGAVAAVRGTCLIIEQPNTWQAAWIEKHYLSKLQRLVEATAPGVTIQIIRQNPCWSPAPDTHSAVPA